MCNPVSLTLLDVVAEQLYESLIGLLLLHKHLGAVCSREIVLSAQHGPESAKNWAISCLSLSGRAYPLL